MIEALDAIDGDADFDPTADDDCCPAGDDDLGVPGYALAGDGHPGEPEDIEEDDDLEASLQPPVTPGQHAPDARMGVRMSRRDEDEVLTSRTTDVAIMRAAEEAERHGAGRTNMLLRDLAQHAVFRSRTAIGVTVRRRPLS